jgi:hypothetical protein
MSDPPELAKLFERLEALHGDGRKLLKQAFDLGAAQVPKAREDGIALGIAQERRRIAKLVESPSTETYGVTTRTNGGDQVYGAIAAPVRDALRDICRTKPTATIREIYDHARQAGHNLEIGQVRTALKVLARKESQVAKRVVRGQYAPGPKMPPPPAPPSADKVRGLVAPALPLN